MKATLECKASRAGLGHQEGEEGMDSLERQEEKDKLVMRARWELQEDLDRIPNLASLARMAGMVSQGCLACRDPRVPQEILECQVSRDKEALWETVSAAILEDRERRA